MGDLLEKITVRLKCLARNTSPRESNLKSISAFCFQIPELRYTTVLEQAPYSLYRALYEFCIFILLTIRFKTNAATFLFAVKV